MQDMSVQATVPGGQQMVVNIGGQQMQVMVPMAFMSPFAVLFIYVWDSGTVKYDKKLTVGGEPLKYSKE